MANEKINLITERPSTDEMMIYIPFEEYKELLIIKGKYEELKSQQQVSWTSKPNVITYRDFIKENEQLNPRKVTCEN